MKLTLDLLWLKKEDLSLWPPTNCHRDKCQEIGPTLMKNCTMNKWADLTLLPCFGCLNLPSSDPQDLFFPYHTSPVGALFCFHYFHFTLVCPSKSLEVKSSVSHGCYMTRNIWQKRDDIISSKNFHLLLLRVPFQCVISVVFFFFSYI